MPAAAKATKAQTKPPPHAVRIVSGGGGRLAAQARAFLAGPLLIKYIDQSEGVCMRSLAMQQHPRQTRRWLAEHITDSVRAGHMELVLLMGGTRGTDIMASCSLLLDRIWNTCIVESVCVGPAHRGRGLCQVLMRAAIARARTLGVRRIAVHCQMGDAVMASPEACACYERAFGAPVHVSSYTTAYELEL